MEKSWSIAVSCALSIPLLDSISQRFASAVCRV